MSPHKTPNPQRPQKRTAGRQNGGQLLGADVRLRQLVRRLHQRLVVRHRVNLRRRDLLRLGRRRRPRTPAGRRLAIAPPAAPRAAIRRPAPLDPIVIVHAAPAPAPLAVAPAGVLQRREDLCDGENVRYM